MKFKRLNKFWPCGLRLHTAAHKIMRRQAIICFYGIIFISSLFEINEAAPSTSLHSAPAIWNHDGVKGGSLLGLHDYNDDRQGSSASEANNSQRLGMRKSGDQPLHHVYLLHASDVSIKPAYENTVNPFLSHIEQGWKLKPKRHRYMRKKLMQTQQQQKMTSINSHGDELFGQLPMDPEKPHFMDSTEADDTAEENRDFGDEEKDLRDLFQTLLSSDY